MPEEINRLVTDALSRWLLTPSEDADANLMAEGAHPDRIVCVGNIMADSLFRAVERSAPSNVLERLGVTRPYVLATLHRASLVDDRTRLGDVLSTLGDLPSDCDVVYPVHPRTRSNITRFGITVSPRIRMIEPLGYLDFVHTEANAQVVFTDSGGVQEETTMLGIPCVTIRENTERPITVSEGTNVVVGFSRDRILSAAEAALSGSREPRRPPMWDGQTARRVVDVLLSERALTPVPEHDR